jgi:phosphoesterase RecJ-like protein
LLGIISDTARHKFDNPLHRETYRIVSDLLDAGASIEQLEAKTERFSKDQIKVLAQLLDNIEGNDGFTFSFISDKFADEWIKGKKSIDDFKNGCEEFTAKYLRGYEQNLWGFIVYQELIAGSGIYSVSLRSVSGVKDVSKIAHILGGGGHKPAAGAKFEAASVEEAISKVKQAIQQVS